MPRPFPLVGTVSVGSFPFDAMWFRLPSGGAHAVGACLVRSSRVSRVELRWRTRTSRNRSEVTEATEVVQATVWFLKDDVRDDAFELGMIMSISSLDFQDHEQIVDLVFVWFCSVKSLVDSVQPIKLMVVGSLG